MNRTLRKLSFMLVVLNILFWAFTAFRSLPRLCKMPVLGEVGGAQLPDPAPSLSVIFAARDEERSVGKSLRRMIEQDYPDLQVIAVDDRSADGRDPGLHGRPVPQRRGGPCRGVSPGWLGKTYALRLGASRASGEWLLFTDADVQFSPECLRYALGYAVARGPDHHMTLVPDLVSRDAMLRSFVAAFQTPSASTNGPGRQKRSLLGGSRGDRGFQPGPQGGIRGYRDPRSRSPAP